MGARQKEGGVNGVGGWESGKEGGWSGRRGSGRPQEGPEAGLRKGEGRDNAQTCRSAHTPIARSPVPAHRRHGGPSSADHKLHNRFT